MNISKNYSNSNTNSKYTFARKTNWTNKEYQYLKNVKITEWDIKSAGLSVIKYKKILPESEIKKLESMSKEMRTIREGLFQKENPYLAEAIVNTLSDVREFFVSSNDISEMDTLSIKKDAIFLINKRPQINNILGNFEFREKSSYSSYINLNKIEFYYNSITDELDTKGLSKESIEFQKEYLLKDIRYFLKSSEKFNKQQIFAILKNYRQKYLNMELPVETYRELESGMFRVNGYFIKNVDSSILKEIDISQNYMNFIYPLFQLLL